MDRWSGYHGLSDRCEVEPPPDPARLYRIIHDLRGLGEGDPTVIESFRELTVSLRNETMLRACTRLPLIPNVGDDKDRAAVTRMSAA